MRIHADRAIRYCLIMKRGDMVTDHELLLAISDIIDKKIVPIKNDIKTIKVDILENKVLPRLSGIENIIEFVGDLYML